MENGSTISFVHKVNGENDYLTGTFLEILTNGRYLVRMNDGTEFELDKEEITTEIYE